MSTTRCPTCDGSGLMPQPDWQRYERDAPAGTRACDWFREQGLEFPSFQELDCSACNGTGERLAEQPVTGRRNLPPPIDHETAMRIINKVAGL